VLDRRGYLQYEPALEVSQQMFVGALRLPGDETGDCYAFTNEIARLAKAAGAKFNFEVEVRSITASAGRVTGVETNHGSYRGDHVLVALGSFSASMIASLGVRIPVYPVKGYSITVPITDIKRAPQSTVMDETHKVAVTRLGDRIRVGGTAQLSGFDMSLPPARRKTLEFVVNDLFPGSGDVARAEFWCGLRPMTPDGTPIIGPTSVQGLWLATGHGTLGWTMAAGTGRLLADWMVGVGTGIDTAGLTISRYERGHLVGEPLMAGWQTQ
jgi:D-amino-acid dehydrogenase